MAKVASTGVSRRRNASQGLRILSASFKTTGHLVIRSSGRPTISRYEQGEPQMPAKLSLSLIAVLALSTAGAVACASVNPTSSKESGARPSSPTNDEINALESGSPDSVDYRNREIPRRSPTNDEINALENGNPDSVDYRNREIPRRSPTNDEINAAKTHDPNSVDNKDRRGAPKKFKRPAHHNPARPPLPSHYPPN